MKSIVFSLTITFLLSNSLAFSAMPKGTTQITAGMPSYTWNGNTATVTIVVTHELASTEASWVGESRATAHVTLPFGVPPPVALTTTSDSFPNGNPTPGGGGKNITYTYTFTVQDGWDWTFDASMLYKKLPTDVNPTTKSLTRITGNAVK